MSDELTKCEVAAMWLYGADYAKTGMGAIEWWKQLDASRRRVVQDFVARIEKARND